jgi:hypothetical protein
VHQRVTFSFKVTSWCESSEISPGFVSASGFEIHFNAWNIYTPESDPQRLVVNATNFVTHDQFFANAEVTLYDIAIIYLDSPLVGITPVKLPAKSDDYPLDGYLSVKAIGYGQEDRMPFIYFMSKYYNLISQYQSN